MQLQMKQTYWFKRFDPEKNKQKRSRTVTPDKSSQMLLIPDDTLGNQIKRMSQKIIHICQQLQQVKKFHMLWHQELAKEEKVTDLRCMQHSNSIILYCQEDHKLLCANCVFSNRNHKNHNVVDASKSILLIENDLQKNQKNLKSKAGNLVRQKAAWAQLLQKIQKNHLDVLQSLQKEHDKAAQRLATFYLKCKNKLQQLLQSTKHNFQQVIDAFGNLNKTLIFSHSIKNVRHLFVSQVIDRFQQIEQTIPSSRIGDKIYYMHNVYMSNILKYFKTATNQFLQ